MEFNINVHHYHHYDLLNHKLDKIMGALEDIKAKLAISDQKIDILVTATDGVAQDVAHLKELVSQNPGGINAAGVAELSALIDAQDQKLATAGSKLQALDAETDPSAGS
jgi:hypothetical protein